MKLRVIQIGILLALAISWQALGSENACFRILRDMGIPYALRKSDIVEESISLARLHRKARSGDIPSQTEWAARLTGWVWPKIAREVGNPHRSAEVLQATLSALLRVDCKQEERYLPMAFTAVKTKIIDGHKTHLCSQNPLRKLRVITETDLRWERSLDIPDPRQQVETEKAWVGFLLEELHSFVHSQLNAADLEVYRIAIVQQLSHAEGAAKLGIEYYCYANRLSRLRKRLKTFVRQLEWNP